MTLREQIARNLAAALLAREWTPTGMAHAMRAVLGRSKAKAQTALIVRLIELDAGPAPPTPQRIVRMLLDSDDFHVASAAIRRGRKRLQIVLSPPLPQPSAEFFVTSAPHIATTGDLADWLGLSPRDLDWFAGARRQARHTLIPVLQHYRFAFIPKRSGLPRLVEEPKPRLKAIQRRILHEILTHAPPHQAAHGFVAGRSALTSAEKHAGEVMVVTLDLESFFTRTPARRIHAIFHSLGYPWAVARALTGLCTTETPPAVFARPSAGGRHDPRVRQLFATPHLPQGAPTSPALANLAAWQMDVRLTGLAKSFSATYTRYADDLAFSGGEELAGRVSTLIAAVSDIVGSEGHALNAAKTHVMPTSRRQRVTGIVVNDRCNVPRDDYDRLKAILHNCRRNGPEAENRNGHRDFRAHLEGRVGWVEQVNPARGAKLRRMLAGIRWDLSPSPPRPSPSPSASRPRRT